MLIILASLINFEIMIFNFLVLIRGGFIIVKGVEIKISPKLQLFIFLLLIYVDKQLCILLFVGYLI